MATKFAASTKLDLAISRVTENEPKDWTSVEHLAMLRYLIIECSKQNKATVGEIEYALPDGKVAKKVCLQLDGIEVTELTVDLGTLKKEMNQCGKLAECSNFKKWLSETSCPEFASVERKKAEYH